MARVLIIDDDPGICHTLSVIVRQNKHAVDCAFTLEEGMMAAAEGDYAIVFLDVQMPDGNGLKFLPKIMKVSSAPEVIIMTGQGTLDGAELAIRNGAWDYIQKPSSIKEMTLPFVRALQYRKEKQFGKRALSLKRDGIIGSSVEIMACLDQIATAASSDGNVLISGETGTGKELFARATHDNSPRCKENYVVFDCASLPDSLVESTLFGYEKGAFTGADNTKKGIIKHADHGTILLDELGELPLEAQKSFLRVLQEKRFRPVGGKEELSSDFRVIATTNRDLEKMVREGKFRKDLLYRLRTFFVHLPPLRKRHSDIKEIAMYHMAKLCERYAAGIKGYSPDFIMALSEYNWPGNVRELVNALEHVLAVSGPEPTLFPKHLPDKIRIKLVRNKVFRDQEQPIRQQQIGKTTRVFPNIHEFRKNAMAELEKNYLLDLLEHAHNNINRACSISEIGKSRLYELIKRYNINYKTG